MSLGPRPAPLLKTADTFANRGLDFTRVFIGASNLLNSQIKFCAAKGRHRTKTTTCGICEQRQHLTNMNK